MFSHLSLSHSVHGTGGGLHGGGACVAGGRGVHVGGGACLAGIYLL